MRVPMDQAGVKMSSMVHLKVAFIAKASGKKGSKRPRSMEMTVCRETPSRSAGLHAPTLAK